jgi:LysR family hydrogen peroxide-inducible transcriptional activator
MPYLVAPLIADCRTKHPNLLIHAREDFRHTLVRAVVEGELDLAVVALPVKDPRLSIEPLLTEPLLLVVGQRHPFADRKEIGIADLVEETFVSMGDSSTLATQIQGFFGDHNFVPKIGYRCAQVATLKLFVSMGLGISILPQVAHTHDDEGRLTYLHISGTTPTREIAVIRHLQRYQSRGVEQFLGLLRGHARAGGFSAPPQIATPGRERES